MGGLETAGVMQREKRPFRPHLTVARFGSRDRCNQGRRAVRLRFAVESVCLYRSELKREGAIYTVLARTGFRSMRGRARGLGGAVEKDKALEMAVLQIERQYGKGLDHAAGRRIGGAAGPGHLHRLSGARSGPGRGRACRGAGWSRSSGLNRAARPLWRFT